MSEPRPDGSEITYTEWPPQGPNAWTTFGRKLSAEAEAVIKAHRRRIIEEHERKKKDP